MNKIEAGIIAAGYDYLEVGPQIYMVYDFLSDEEIDSVMSQINNATQEDWEAHYMEGIKGLAERKFGRTDIDNLVEEGLLQITYHWIDKNLPMEQNDHRSNIGKKIAEIIKYDEEVVFDGVGTIQRQYEGAELREHVDDHSDPLIRYAVIMYINDDYADGELFFGNLGLKLKPPPKAMLIFPSGEAYLHGVLPPGAGPHRYVLPSFVREKNGKYDTAPEK